MILWKVSVFICLVVYGNCAKTDGKDDALTPQTSSTHNTSPPSTDESPQETSELSTDPSATVTPESSTSVSDSSNAPDASDTTETSKKDGTEPETLSSTSSTTSDEVQSPLTSPTPDKPTTEENESTSQSDIDTEGDTILTPETNDTNDDYKTDATETPTSYGDDESTPTTELPTTEGLAVLGCSSSPCIHGGNCTDNSTVPGLYSCTCPSGYTGLHCEVTDKCVKSENGKLCKNGACFYSADGLVRFCGCFNGEFWDEETMKCRAPDLPCFPNPCQNGGTCSVEGKDALCECRTGYEGDNCTIYNTCDNCDNGTCELDSSRTKKYCKCNAGLHWDEHKKMCEVESLPCFPNPCKNGGTCYGMESGEFNCSCKGGSSGKTCKVIDLCTEDDDCGHGNCTLSDDEKTRMCHCKSEFYLEERTHTCQRIAKPCQPNPCSHDGICLPSSESSFTCVCPDGYTGDTCKTRDMCEMDGGNGFCVDATCTSVDDLKVYYCKCSEYQYFDYSKRKCLDLDLCSLKLCAPTEECINGTCKCKEYYHYNNNTGVCEPNFCSSSPCPIPGMICEEGSGSSDYQCRCRDGLAFNGTHCNEVLCVFSQLNHCGQSCSLTDGSHICGCEEGFQLNEDNRTCIYTGNATCTNKTCDMGFCVVKKGMEVCVCPTSYIEKNGKCVDICKAGRMTRGICPGDECETVPGEGFKCKCEGKYAFSKDKVTCMARSVCKVNEIGWKTCSKMNALCVPDWSSDAGFRCTCPEGLVETEGGICRDACTEEISQQWCSSKRATCDVDSEGKVICRCPPYLKENSEDGICNKLVDHSYLITLPVDQEIYEKSRQKRSVEKTIDLKRIRHDISDMAQQLFPGFSDVNIVSCIPESDYILCKVELQFDTVQKADLKRLEIRDVCVAVDSSNRCILPPALVIVKDRFSEEVSIQPTDPCDEDIKEELCGSETVCTRHPHTTKYFNCTCIPGFLTRRRIYPFETTQSIIEICRDIDECTESDPCPENSNCINTIGSFQCSCKPGFRNADGTSDSNEKRCVGICNPNPCTHGKCSPRGNHEFDCTCEAGFRGTFCNLEDKNFKEMRINTVIVGVVLGGVLLITIILFIACISRLRKKKSLEESGQMFYSSAEMTERRRVEGGVVNNAFRRE